MQFKTWAGGIFGILTGHFKFLLPLFYHIVFFLKIFLEKLRGRFGIFCRRNSKVGSEYFVGETLR